MTSNDGGSTRANDLGWAHLCLAVAQQRRADALAKDDIRTTVLVDADIVISQAFPKQRAALFHALGVARGRATPQHLLLAAVGAYFFDWLFRSQSDTAERPEQDGVDLRASTIAYGESDTAERPERDQWRIAPEHYREVVRNAKLRFDELGPSDAMEPAPTQAESDDEQRKRQNEQLTKLTKLLDQLRKDPWAPIDSDLAALLDLLGVEVDAPHPVHVVEVLIGWMQRYGNHVLGAGRGSAAPGTELLWPGFVKNDEWDLLWRWRELLAPHCLPTKPRGAIDNDARVLAALTMLNRDWRAKKHRVVLLTGSSSILQTVRGQALDPRGSSALAQEPGGGDAMFDFIRLPTQVLALPDFGGAGATQPSVDPPPVSDLLLDRAAWTVEERRSLFEFIVSKGSDKEDGGAVGDAAHARLNALRHYHFADYFRKCIETSMALRHISTKLAEEREQRIASATAEVGKASDGQDLVEQLRELNQMRQVRARIDLLELLIATDRTTAQRVDSKPRVNRLRSTPVVDWGRYDDAKALSDALAETGASTKQKETERQQHLAQLKVAVYKYDLTTYLLVLVFARHYAAQGRWELASNAARYAFELTQTRAYDQRGADILGEESIFLDLACRRRGAQTPDDIEKVLVALGDYQKNALAENLKLAEVRFGVERVSLSLTRLLMAFFKPKTLDRALREEAGRLLREALAQMDELQRVLDATPALLLPSKILQNDLHNRLLVNVCNLAWLTVVWPHGELERSLRVTDKRTSFKLHQDEATVARVDDCLKQLVEYCKQAEGDQNRMSRFDWLSMVLCALHLEPAVLQWHDEPARGAVLRHLEALRGEEVVHPYDSARVRYALALAGKLSH